MTVTLFDFPASLADKQYPNVTMNIPEKKQNEEEKQTIANIDPQSMIVTVFDLSGPLVSAKRWETKIPEMKQNAAEQQPIANNEEEMKQNEEEKQPIAHNGAGVDLD